VLTLYPEEPSAAPWRVRPIAEVAAELVAVADGARPAVVGVDGRSAGGKSTVATRLAAALPGAAVVHTDDVAWYESFFGWDDLLARHVLHPARDGRAVCWRPPAWDARGRSGAIEVAAGVPVLLVEGVGATRRSLAPMLDAAIWVQSDLRLARARGIARDLAQRPDRAEAEEFWDRWDAQEVRFLAEDRPWDRADLVLCGTPEEDPHPDEVAVGTLS
jgi:pantothenate kinase